MAIARRVRRKATELAFESLSIEGGLLSPEWLSKITQLQASGQAEADYRIVKGLNVRDEVGRYWRIAQALWSEFRAGLSGGADRKALAERFLFSLFEDVLGFDLATQGEQIEVDGHSAPLTWYGSHGRVPIAVADAAEGLDTPSGRFGDGVRRRSASGVVQEYLNAPRRGLWGIASDGLRLRLLRENGSLTRPTWVEADLERLFTENRYSDFVALWLLLHHTRFGKADASPEDCWLEAWRVAGREDGVRARDHLRDGVEAAVVALGQGFLSQRDNQGLRQSLTDGSLSTHAYFQLLLRLVYRLIFLLTVEERNLLHPPHTTNSARAVYEEGYSLRKLRERSSRRTARDRFTDLWDALTIVFRGLADGEPRLALPALGGLFAEEHCRQLDCAKIENNALLDAVFRLGWLREDSGLARVNWRDMGPEELGSIYESLLELHPQLSLAERRFRFASSSESKGNARKLTSSFYTHDSLVQTLLDAAVDPLIERTIAENPEDGPSALLGLTLVDPACGSGHFLLGAARRVAAQVARLRVGGTPSLSEYREAMRSVISSCVYGVDRNPMAVELCKTALWIETVVPGRPLSFLDSHIRCGDALIGVFDLALLASGIPSAAYVAREGDSKNVAANLRGQNTKRVKDILTLPLFAAAAGLARAVELLPEETVEEVRAKRVALLAAESTPSMIATSLRCDLFCGAFFSRKTATTELSVPLTSDIDKIAINQPARSEAVIFARKLALEHRFFHWPLMFPDVFERGGFDLVLGNPPWKPMSPDAKEWFAPYDPEVRELAPDLQEKRIADLLAAPGMQDAWDAHCRALYDAATFMKESGRFRMFAEGNLGKGDFNVYRMFVETALSAVRSGGVVTQFVPENLYNGANASAIRAWLFANFDLRLLVGFENTQKIWFSSVHASAKFCLYVANRGGPTEKFAARFGVNSLTKLEAARSGDIFVLPVAQIRRFSPDALAITEVFHETDVVIIEKLHSRYPQFGDNDISGLGVRHYMREIDLDSGRQLFRDIGVTLYEGRMVEEFDYRAKVYVSGRARRAVWRKVGFGETGKGVLPQWRIPAAMIPSKIGNRWQRFRLGFCRTVGPTNRRTLMATLIPEGVLCGDDVPTIIIEPEDSRVDMLWLGVVNAICLDHLARKMVSLKLSYTILDSLPLPRRYNATELERQIAALALKLSATGPEMRVFWERTAPLLGLDPTIEHPLETVAEREQARAELDVLVARDLFGLTRGEMCYVLDPRELLGQDCDFETFGALRRAELREFNEFRTRRLILEKWDTLPRFHDEISEASVAS